MFQHVECLHCEWNLCSAPSPSPAHFPEQCRCPVSPARSPLLFAPFLGRRSSFSFKRCLHPASAEGLGLSCRVLCVYKTEREGCEREIPGAGGLRRGIPGTRGAAAPSRGRCVRRSSGRRQWQRQRQGGSGKAGVKTRCVVDGFRPAV